MILEPLGNRVIIQPIEGEEMTAGGVYLPEQARDKPQKGIVLAVGDKVRRVTVDDEVLYSRFNCTEIEVERNTFLVAKERDLLARCHEVRGS